MSDILGFLRRVEIRQTVFKEAESLYCDRLAPKFSLFDFINPDEMKLSEILAWLLNPRGSHGQGNAFLRLFLEQLEAGWPIEGSEHAEVKTENSVEEGRLDISISYGNRYCIIENKPWAANQHRQVERYLEYLDKRKRGFQNFTPSDFPLVYLTADGLPPPNYSLSEDHEDQRRKSGQLHAWGYRSHLLHWLRQCQLQCRADRVGAFIYEFTRYIRSQFGGSEDVTMQDHLVSEITKSPELVSAAIQVVLAGEQIKEGLLQKLKGELSDAQKQNGWTLEWDVSPSKYSGITIVYSHHSACVFRLQFELSQYRSAIYGITKTQADQVDYGDARERLLTHLGYGHGAANDPVWPWLRPLKMDDELLPFEANWGLSEQPWAAIADGRMAGAIISAANLFRDILLYTQSNNI